MAEQVRLWEICAEEKEETLVEINRTILNREERIEKWLMHDISLLGPDLLIIGEQVETAYNKLIDLLCIDNSGNLVVVELKRDMTPRDVTAQALDYASWVKDLTAEEIEDIASKYFKGQHTLGEAFRAKFNDDLPEIVNEHHSMRIVASEIDDSTMRIIRYLSESYSVDINAATFQFYRASDGHEFLSRTFTVAPVELEASIAKMSGKRIHVTWDLETFRNDAVKRGLADEVIASMTDLLKTCDSLPVKVQWGRGAQCGSFNVSYPAINSSSFLSVFSDGHLTLNFGNVNSSKDAADFRDQFKELVTTRLGLEVPGDYQKRFPTYLPKLWSPKIGLVIKILRELVEGNAASA